MDKACLEKISARFKLKESIAGIILAFGCSLPEMTTNILSCTNSRKSMIGYGFGTIVGSGVFGIYFKFYFYFLFCQINVFKILKII